MLYLPIFRVLYAITKPFPIRPIHVYHHIAKALGYKLRLPIPTLDFLQHIE